MRKLTRESLAELAMRMPVLSENVQSSYVGGGNGTRENPFTFGEYKDLGSLFTEGWVDLPDSISYLTHDYDYYFGDSGYDMLSFLGGSGYDGTSGYWGGSGYDGTSGYWSGDSDGYSSDKDQIIQELKNQLPADLVASFSVDVRYSSTITSPGQYDPNTNTIYLKELNYDTLFAEYVHLVQKKKNLCGDNHAAKEFQEHIIGDIMSTYRSVLNNTLVGYRTSDSDDYVSWINSCIDERGVNMRLFEREVDKFIPYFFEYKSNVPQYQGEIPSGYNFDWKEMLQTMGIPYYY